ncbi:hypothetical protein E5161_01320 [Cohnella pontilimi]|uniref:YCII-related domain-containing protein n=1 Tax=Cohnella pontilimi TaxID=2564100 RepID=A0A4U0FGD6_9BACL|nr:YciI family protein [Cohnella pontilimi]TJY44066.1 hypothetical protein E5161_01320 [Cohnella pontilimi]
MKFLCVGYFDRAKMDARPEQEINAVMSECEPHLEDFYKSGQVIMDAGLGKETKSMQRVKGKVKITDGPFAEAKETIGSVFVIEARDMEDAIRVASLHPAIQVAVGEQFGWRVEIRPIHHFEKSEQQE